MKGQIVFEDVLADEQRLSEFIIDLMYQLHRAKILQLTDTRIEIKDRGDEGLYLTITGRKGQ